MPRPGVSLLVAATILAAASCGHRGDPLPPLRRTPPAPGEFRLAQRGETLELRAAVRAVAGRERGPRSLTQALVVRAPLEVPRELTAALAEDGVALAWRGARPRPPEEPPGNESTPGDVRGGFFVYRRTGGAAYAGALQEEPLDRRNHRDTTPPAGLQACYVVRAVASTDPLVESGPSNEACVTVRDIAAPATPAGLAVLPRDAGLEVLWGPGTEPDLGGYRVYRTAPGGERQRVAEVPPGRAAWLDGTAEPGVAYRYEVTAFDTAGNESPPSEPAEGRR